MSPRTRGWRTREPSDNWLAAWLQYNCDARLDTRLTAQARIQRTAEDLRVLNRHWVHKNDQRAEFEREVEEGGAEGVCTIVIDFKAHWRAGGKMRVETDDAHWNRVSFATCGVIAWLPTACGVGCKPLYMTYVSPSMDQTTYAAQRVVEAAIAELQSYEEWASVRRLSAWADCGPHFRGCNFVGYMLDTLPRAMGLPINLNFFCEKHGKTLLDGWFRVLDGFFELALKSLSVERALKKLDQPDGTYSAADVCAAVRAQHEKSAPQPREKDGNARPRA